MTLLVGSGPNTSPNSPTRSGCERTALHRERSPNDRVCGLITEQDMNFGAAFTSGIQFISLQRASFAHNCITHNNIWLFICNMHHDKKVDKEKMYAFPLFRSSPLGGVAAREIPGTAGGRS